MRLTRDDGGEWTFAVVARFVEHESMNYGSDVQPESEGMDREGSRERMVVSTSFYDKRLCLWRVDGSKG